MTFFAPFTQAVGRCRPLALALLAVPVLAQAQPSAITTLSAMPVDSQGHPRLRWTPPAGSYTYQVERQTDRYPGGETSCPSGETLSSGWCVLASVSTAPAAPPATGVVFTDNVVRVDPADPTEFRYRVKTVDGSGSSAYTTSWTSNCDTPPSVNLLDWLKELKNNSGIRMFTDLEASDIAGITDGIVHITEINPVGGIPNFYVLANDLYIAIIGKNGGLVSLTHRHYPGADFVLPNLDQQKIPNADSWSMRINQLGSPATSDTIVSSQAGAPSSISVASGGDGLQFTWTNAGGSGLDVTVTWTLQQAGSSGLHSKIQAVRSATGSLAGGIRSLDFPVVRGLGFPYVDLYWPNSGTGNTYTNFPFRDTDGALWFPAHGDVPEQRGISGEFLDSLRMQFFGISREWGPHMAMYVGAEDPQQLPKRFSVQPHYLSGDNMFAAAASVTHYPMNGTGQSQSSIGDNGDDYAVVLAPMCGGQERVAKRYRRFALQQDWVKAPASSTTGGSGSTLVNAPTAIRTDLNPLVKQGVWWWLQDNGPGDWATPQAQAQYANSLKTLIGPAEDAGKADVGFHVYHWYAPAEDRNMPQYTEREALPGSPDTIRDMTGYIGAVQDAHSVVMPYINAMLVDITDRCSAEDTFCASTSLDDKCSDSFGSNRVCGWFTHPILPGYSTPQNLIYKEFSSTGYADNAVLTYVFDDSAPHPTDAAADVSSPLWQAVTDMNAGKVYGFGAAGVYLDSFGIGYQPDYAELWGISRTRPKGHGSYFRDGSLALAATVRARAHAREVIDGAYGTHFSAAEHFNEAYIRAVDLFTLYEEHGLEAGPLTQLVYSDYALFAGPRARERDTPQARAMRYGRAFTWGVQLGLTGIGGICDTYSMTACDDEPHHSILEYLRTLARSRQHLHAFLSNGEFMGLAEDDSVTVEPGSDGANPGWCVDQGCSKVENDAAPAIRAARWIADDQSRAIIMTNTTSSDSIANIPVPANWRGLSTNCHKGEDGSSDGCIKGGTATTVQVELPRFSVRYITFD